MDYKIATIEDLPFIVSVYNSTIASRKVTADTAPVTVADKTVWFHEHHAATRPLWIVLDNEQQKIGWVSFQDFYGRPAYQGTAEISIYLDEAHRGKGFGKKILLHAIKEAPSLGIHTLVGFIFEQNTESLQLFSRLGFEEWGHLPNIALLDESYCSLKILGLKTM